MNMYPTPLSGLTIIETTSIRDVRGQFTRIFCETELAALQPGLHWQQINLSNTAQRGTVRGMHFQHPPVAETKLIRCLRGSVFDVAIDLRTGSPTFLQWHAVELSENNSMQYLIPEGFAHGFQSLTDDVQLLYLHTHSWSREHEDGIRYDDPAIRIDWPLPVTQISEKDRNLPLLTSEFTGIQT